MYRHYTTGNPEKNNAPESNAKEPNATEPNVPPLNENKIPDPEATNNTQEEKEQKEEEPVQRKKDFLEKEYDWGEEDWRERLKRREIKERKKLYKKINLGLLAASGLFIVCLALEGTLGEILSRINRKIQNFLFKITNPTLGWKYALLPPSPVKHYTIVVDFQDLVHIEYGTKKQQNYAPMLNYSLMNYLNFVKLLFGPLLVILPYQNLYNNYKELFQVSIFIYPMQNVQYNTVPLLKILVG